MVARFAEHLKGLCEKLAVSSYKVIYFHRHITILCSNTSNLRSGSTIIDNYYLEAVDINRDQRLLSLTVKAY